MHTAQSCFQCGKKGVNLYSYVVCDSCKSKLKLFTDKTIDKYNSLYKKSADKHSFAEEMRDRLRATIKKNLSYGPYYGLNS